MIINAIWKDEYFTADGINQRTGAADVSSPDYTSFPPFKYNRYDTSGSYETLFAKWLNNGDFLLNEPLTDLSVSYVGMYSDRLPQLHVGGFKRNSSVSTPSFISDADAVNTIFYHDNKVYNDWYSAGYYPSIGLSQGSIFNADDIFHRGQITNFLPDAVLGGTLSDPRNYNNNARMIIYRSFGIKTVFLVIHVWYITGYIDGLPRVQEVTLHEYVSQSAAWKAEHPITSAGCIPYVRMNTNGLYGLNNTGHSFSPCFTLPVTDQSSGDEYLSYAWSLDLNEDRGYFPVYGYITPRLSTNYIIFSGDNDASILLGLNKGTVKNHDAGYWLELDGTDEANIEYIMRGAAAYGMFFADHPYSELLAEGNDLTRWLSDKMCLGTISETGTTNGDYTRGIQNITQRQFGWSDSTQSVYDPDLPPVPENDYSTETDWHVVSDLTTMTQRYVLNAAAVQHLGRELWTISSDLIDDGQGSVDYNNLNDKMLDTFLTQNPIDCIVDLRRYPLEIPKGSSTLLKLGKYETTVGGYVMNKTAVAYNFTMSKKILPLFGDSFLDYEPYTHFELYIPFCGTVSLEPADILGRKLSVRLVVDFTTGTATAYVLSDKLVIKSAQGQIAIDIPVSGVQSVTAASQISNAIIDARVAKAGEIGAVGNLVSLSGITKMLTNPFQTGAQISQAQWQQDRADYNLTHQNISPHIIGAASSASAWAIDLNCRLLIYYPTGAVLTNDNPPEFIKSKLQEYGQTTGFACCMTGQLKSFSGLTVGLNIKMNNIRTNTYQQPATLQELQMIEAAVEEGVIL